MNAVHQIINEIISTGAKFTLQGGEVGLTEIVNDDLLERARKHKTQIKQILESVKRESNTTNPKVWKLKIRSSNGETLNRMTMIDPARMSRKQCEKHLARQFGSKRVVDCIELVKC